MTNQITDAAPGSVSIHPKTDVGLLSLTVANLNNILNFYTQVMGFKLLRKSENSAVLGAGAMPLLVLFEQPEAPLAPQNATGLYHFAVLLPSRVDLGRWLVHLAQSRYPLGGASDHFVSEALYLSDPEGNGIEVYRDRPDAEWRYQANGQLSMGTEALDLDALIDEALDDPQPWNGLPEGTRLGHMHLQVGNIGLARAFYHDVLGFDVVVDMERMGALFVSAGGYHHHIGLNIWHSRGGRQAPAGSTGLRYFTVRLPDEDALAPLLARLEANGIPYKQANNVVEVEDPWHNVILLTTGANLPAELDLLTVAS